MQKTWFSKRLKYATWSIWENAWWCVEMVEQTNVIHKADNGNRVKEEVVLSGGALACMTRRNNMRHFRVKLTPVLRRETRVFGRGNEIKGWGQGDCQSEDRCRQCKAESVHVWTDLVNVTLCGEIWDASSLWRQETLHADKGEGHVYQDMRSWETSSRQGTFICKRGTPKSMVGGSRRRNDNEVRDG